MDEFSDSTAFLPVLEFLQTFNNCNSISVNEANTYIGENCQGYVEDDVEELQKCIRELTLYEQKITSRKNEPNTYIGENCQGYVEDYVEELQKCIRELTLDEQKITSRKNEPVMKEEQKTEIHETVRIENEKSKKKQDRENQASKSEDKRVPYRNVIESSKTNQLGCAALVKKGILRGLSVSHGNMSNFITDQEATRSDIEKTYAHHPFISRIINETLIDSQKRNGTSVIEISSYIDKYNEARMKLLKERFDLCTSNEDKKICYSQTATRTTILKEVSIQPSKTYQLESTAMAENYFGDGVLFSHGNVSNFIANQEATRSDIEKTYVLHPFNSRIINETLIDLQKRNGTSVVEISSFIDKYNEARMEILKKKFDLRTSNEDKKISYSQIATRTTILKERSIRPSKTYQLESTAMAENYFGDAVLFAHEIISNFVTDRNANQKAMKISSPLHPLVSNLVMESQNVSSEFNGASMYEISNSNYDAVEFKIKDVAKPEKCTLGSMEEKAEFVRNAVVQKSKERNRGIGSKEDMRKMNGDAGKCIVKTEDKKYSRKRMGDDSEAIKSDDAYMAKKNKLF